MTFYSYKPKGTTFTPGSSGNSFTPSQPVAFGGGGPSGAGQLPSNLFTQGSRSSVVEFPQRVPPQSLDYMGGVNAAVKAPAHVLERPLAVLNVLTGAKDGQMGAVDHMLNAIGQVGLGSTEQKPGAVSIGSLWGAVSGVLQRSNDLIPALLNSTDSRLAAATADLPDNFVMDPKWLLQHGFDPTHQSAGGSIFGIGSHQKTVGELRTELEKRGFNTDSATGKQISWQEFAQKINKPGDWFAQFMQGDKAINDNQLVNMASRLALDPINLAFGAGAVGRGLKGAEAVGQALSTAGHLRDLGFASEVGTATRFASWAQDGALRLSAAGSLATRPLRWGAGYLSDMYQAGLRATSFAGPEVSAAQFIAGKVANTTLRGLGFAMRSYILPGSGSLLRRYARGALRTEATLGGAEFLAGRLHDAFPNVPIISGFLSDAHDVSQSFMADKPLSDNQIFVFASAFAFPGITLAKQDLSAAADKFRNMAGDGTVAYLGRRWGSLADATLKERATRAISDPLGIHRGTAKEQSVVAAFGGKAELARMLDHMDMRIAYNRLIEFNPWVRETFASFDEAMARGRNISKRVRSVADEMLAERKITPQMRAQMFEDFAKNHASTQYDANGAPLTNVPEAIRFDNLTFPQMVHQWTAYDALQGELASRFQPTADAIVGRAGRLTQEDVRVLIAAVKAGSSGGRTPTGLMTDVLLEHPAMFTDASLSPDAINYWKSLMTLGVAAKGDVAVGGRLSRLARSKNPTYDEAGLVAKLEGIAAVAPPSKELFGEAAAAEAKAAPVPVQAGPISTDGGNREIYTQAGLTDYRAAVQSNVHAVTKHYTEAAQKFEENWTKNGGPRKNSTLAADLARREIKVSPDSYDTIRKQGETLLDEGNHNLAPMTHFEANKAAVTQELYARAQESWGGATYDPHTGEYVMADAPTAAPNEPYLYHGSQSAFMPGIAKSGMRSGSNWIADAKTAASYAVGDKAPLYRAPGSLIGGIEKAKGWVEGNRVDPAKMEVSTDGGNTWSPVVPKPGKFASAVGQTISLSFAEAANPQTFASALDRLVSENQSLLNHSDFYIGVFHDDAYGRVQLDVNILNQTQEQAQAVQTALGRTGGAYDFQTGNGVFGVNPDWVQYISQRTREAYPSVSPEQADAIATTADVAARAWAQQTGRTANEFYSRFVGGIERGLTPAENALFQESAANLHDLINQPPPDVLTKAGMDQAAPIEWAKMPGLAQEIGIPGGLAGLKDPNSTFSLWDLWRLKAQAINPAKLPRSIVEPLYAKIFRSQVRSLETDPLDAMNRMVFALQSPNQNLLANEAIYSALRMRDTKDVQAMASIYDRVLASGIKPDDPRLAQALGLEVQRENGLVQGSEPKGQGVNTISSQIQMGNTVLLARRFLEHPDFFVKKPSESMLEYVERLSAVTPGAAVKVANFGVMVGDPVSHTLGTMDTHIAQLLGMGRKAPTARKVTYRLANGEINPAIPEHLRNLPGQVAPASKAMLKVAPKAMERLLPADGGGTFDPVAGVFLDYTDGYDVGAIQGTFAYVAPGDVEHLAQAMSDAHEKYPSANIGVWHNPDTGMIEVDPVIHVQDQAAAEALSRTNNQKTYRDNAAGKSVANPDYSSNAVVSNQPVGTNWEPKDVTVLGGDYQKAHDLMQQMQSAEGTPFNAGGYQWFKWDQKRGGLEPHTLIYPGAYKLPKMTVSERQTAFAVQQASGYRSASPLTGQAFNPREGFLYQTAEDSRPLASPVEMTVRTKSDRIAIGAAHAEHLTGSSLNWGDHPGIQIVSRGPEGITVRVTPDPKLYQAGAGGPRGETQFVDDVKGIMRGFDSADFTTAVHEWTHVYRRVLTDSPGDLAIVEQHLGVQNGAWDPAHEEAFSKQMENYLSSGKAANPELQGVFERFKQWLTAIYKGVKGQKVKISPEVKQVFDNLFSQTKIEDYWAPVRRTQQEHLNVLREQVKSARRDVRAIDKQLEAYRTVKIDPRFLDQNGNPSVTPDSLANLQDQTRFIAQNYPQYDLQPAPRLALQYRAEDSHLAALLQERSNLGRMVMDYGPLGKMFRMVEALTSPVKSKQMAMDARQMVANKLIPLGFTPSEIRTFFQRLQSESGSEGPTVGRLQNPMFSGITALPPNAIARSLRDAAAGNDVAIANFAKKYGGVDRAHVMLDEAYNAGVRRVDTKLLQGHTPNALEAAFRAGYYAWTSAPVLRTASDATRLLAKVFYPMFRFQMDVRWQTLNLVEADLMSFFRDGVRATHAGRLVGQRDMLVPRGPKGQPINLSDNAAALHMSHAGVPVPRMSQRLAEGIGTSPDLPRSLQDETGMQMTNRVLYGVLKKEFDVERPQTIMRVINDLPATDPVLKVLIKKFGMDRGTWSDQVAETLYSFDKKGVRHTVLQAAKQVQKYEKWTPTEREMMVPLVDKIIQRNQDLMDNLLAAHVGNVDRSRLERVMNSYWLYWPISYQIKAAKWMVKVMSQRAFGQNSNLGGAWDLARMADMFKQQSNASPDAVKQMENLSPIWFMASMLLPTVPWDPGVSLNRFARYTGGNILGLWDSYSGLDTPAQWAQKFFSMGPIYSINLAGQMAHALFPDQADAPQQPNQ